MSSIELIIYFNIFYDIESFYLLSIQENQSV